MAIFLSRLLIAALRQDQTNSLKKQFDLTDEQILACNEADPSPKGTYSRWLCQVYAQTPGAKPAKLKAVEALKTPLSQFMRLCNNPEFPKDKRDIGQYSPTTLMELVGNQRRYLRNLSPKAIEKLVKTEGLPGAKIIWDGGGFKMWYVTNYKYAMILGSGTHWCTAANEGYASSYSLQGGLYITYYNGKPFLQGHSYGGSIDLLNVDDHQPNFFSPEMVLWLKTVEHPIIGVFRRLCDSRLSNVLEDLDKKELKANEQAIKEYALDSDNLATVKDVIRAKIWWPEGWELLIDSPNYLVNALQAYNPKEICKKLKKQPFATDIAKVCLENNLLHYALMLNLDNGPELLAEMVLSNKLQSIEQLDKATSAEVDEEGVRQIEKMQNNYALLENEGNVALLGPKSVFEYWQRFVNQEWPEMESVIGDNPKYKKRCDLLSSIRRSLRKLKVGDSVVPGPDCEEVFKQGVVKEINDGIVTVIIKGEDKKFTQKRTRFDLQKAETGKVHYVVSIEPMPPDYRFKNGDKVIPGGYFTGVEDIGEYGTITDGAEGANQGRALLTIEWEEGRVDRLHLPDLYYARALAVDQRDAKAVTNYKAKETASKFADFKQDEYVWTESGIGIIQQIDPDDQTFYVRYIDGPMIDDGSWYPDKEIKKLERKPTTWHVVSPQPDELMDGMWVKRGPDWDWSDQDTRGMAEPEEVVPGQVQLEGEYKAGMLPVGWYRVKWPKYENNYKYLKDFRGLEVIEKY